MTKKIKNRIAFYVDYESFNSKEAPPILFFISFLRNKGYEVDFFASEKKLLEGFENAAKSVMHYDVCLLSLMSSDKLRKILQTAIKVKEYSPFTVNVLGGTGVYGYYKDLIEAEGVDIAIEGDAEKILPAVLESIVNVLDQNNVSDLNNNGDYKTGGINSLIFQNYPEKLTSGITRQEAYYCTPEHMNLLFKRKGRYLSPILKIPENIFFERIFSGYTVKCPISNTAIKLNDGNIRFFEKIDASHEDFSLFYSNYKNIMTEDEFVETILPFPTESEINAEYTDYPWDIYDDFKFESVGLYAQRGCNWGQCTYCSIVNYKYRKLSVKLLLKVLKEADSHNVYGFSFDDDLFVQNKIWLNEFLDGIIAGKFNKKFSFTAMFKVEHITEEDILNKLKQANFTKIQIGVESFLPEKISYFLKTKKNKERSYIDKAKKIIDYCASIKIVPSSFIILTIPDKNFSLFDIVSEMGEIIDVIIDVYDRHKVVSVFLFNDFINAYPNAPLLNRHAYSKFIVPLCGEIKKVKNEEGANTDTLNLKTIEVPYLYKFENLKIAHFIDLLIKNKNTDKSNKIKTAEETDINEMFVNIVNILNSLNAAFDLYGTPEFLLYDIIDGLIATYDGNDDIIKKIITEYFNVSDINKFKNYIASGKIDRNNAVEIFSSIIAGFDELKERQEEKKLRGKFITGVLNERLGAFIKQYYNNLQL
ncbi:MAG: radical SAM protein [Candidatus Acidulodesulfobacterium sp.]